MIATDFGKNLSSLILINARFGLSKDAPMETLVLVQGRVLMEREAARQLNLLMEAVDGWRHITPVSGWRSMREQTELYNSSLRENGLEFTRKFVAKPGHSEHQTGLAIDLGLTQETIDFIRPDFPYHGICQTVRERAAEFGFVERYPAGKESITGIAHEPWHFRYVGTPHAAVMKERGWTLEEYHQALSLNTSACLEGGPLHGDSEPTH